MAVTIKIGKQEGAPSVTLELDVRKSMNGDLMIFDHGDIDIVLSASKNKVTAFPKEVISDLVYGAQNRLFSFFKKMIFHFSRIVQKLDFSFFFPKKSIFHFSTIFQKIEFSFF